ncbi:MAG: VOC family protein [Acidimicrobiia bacterium]|nr:VOC family protein [Acidimicrobiia bacterium]
MALELGFSHVVLKVRDLGVMLDFYTDVLEFEVVDRGPLDLPNRGDLPPLHAEIVFLSQDPYNHHQLAMLPVRGDDDPAGPVDHMAFKASGIDAVRALAKRLGDTGVKIRPVSHGNTWSCYFKDPEGNGIEIYADTPFHVSQPQAIPVDLFQDDDELLAWTTETFSDEADFRPKADYEAERARHLAERH